MDVDNKKVKARLNEVQRHGTVTWSERENVTSDLYTRSSAEEPQT